MPKTRNRYGYCWNNPVGMVDLNGMEPEVPDMNSLLQPLRPQEETQFPEFVNPFETMEENKPASDFFDFVANNMKKIRFGLVYSIGMGKN